MKRSLVAKFAPFILLICPLAAQEEVLTNDTVIKMAKAGLSENIILMVIRDHPAKFDTEIASLGHLRSAGVSNTIIEAMMTSGDRPSAPPPSASAKPLEVQSAVRQSTTASVKIPNKTPVKLSIVETISSAKSKSGETFNLLSAEDVIVNSLIVIRKGARARGRITAVGKRNILRDSNGKLEFVLDYVEAVDGQKVALSSAAITKGGDTTGVGRISSNAEFKAGAMVETVTDGDKEVAASPQ